MKIDILHGPPADIFRDRRRYILIFVALLTVACCGVLLGVYAVLAQTSYYEQLETVALVLFVAPSPFAVYFGEKLQGYKELTPPQREKLAALGQQYREVKNYCDLVAKTNRQPIRMEYEACKDWAEEVNRQG